MPHRQSNPLPNPTTDKTARSSVEYVALYSSDYSLARLDKMRISVAVNLLLALVPDRCGASHGRAAEFDIRFVDTPTSSPRTVHLRRQNDNATQALHLPLRRVRGPSQKSHWLRVAGGVPGERVELTNSTSMTFWRTSQYIGNISVGNQDFQVAIDTGSSDTWVVHEDFVCLDGESKPLPVCSARLASSLMTSVWLRERDKN